MSGKSKALPTIVVASAGIAAGAAVAFAGFLLKRRAVRTTCKPFYAEATRRFKIPGISEGFVPQDLFYLSDEQTWLFSGYLANRRPSPIYQVGADGTVRRHEVRLPEGSLYRGHGAAVTAAGPFVFLTVRDGFIALDRAELAKAADGDVLQATGHRAVPLMPAFMTVQKDMLYIGEFSHRLSYPTPKSHWLRCPSGETNPALLLAYAPHDGGPFGFGEHPLLPPMYFPPFTPMIHNRSRQPAPAGYANVFPPLSAPPPNLSRNARASRARALSEPG